MNGLKTSLGIIHEPGGWSVPYLGGGGGGGGGTDVFEFLIISAPICCMVCSIFHFISIYTCLLKHRMKY